MLVEVTVKVPYELRHKMADLGCIWHGKKRCWLAPKESLVQVYAILKEEKVV